MGSRRRPDAHIMSDPSLAPSVAATSSGPNRPPPVPRLVGVIVTYRRPEAFAAHLVRLAEQTRPLDHLLVIDNDAGGSSAEVRAAVTAYERGGPQVSYERSASNLGPAGAIAVGMERAIETASDDDWIVLLDDDDPPAHDDVFERLLALANDVGGSASTADPVGAVGLIGSSFDRRAARLVRLADDDLDGVIDVDYIGGNQFPMYRVGAVRATGVFERRLFWGYDDLDYGLRLRRAGFRLVISGELARRARAHHGRLGDEGTAANRAAAAATSGWRRYYATRNLIHVLRKQGLDKVAMRRSVVAGVAKPLRDGAGHPAATLTFLRLGLQGVADGWSDRMGRRVAPREKPT